MGYQDELYVGIEWETQLSVPALGNKQIFAMYQDPDGFDRKRELTSIYLSFFTNYPIKDVMNNDLFDVFPILHDPPKPLYFKSSPMEYFPISLDVGNIEVRSFPTKLRDVNQSIKAAESELAAFTNSFTPQHDYGLFLPTSLLDDTNCIAPSKHLNFSAIGIVDSILAKEYFPKYKNMRSIEVASEDAYGDYTNEYFYLSPGYSDMNHCYRLHISVPYNYTDYDHIGSLVYTIIKSKSKSKAMDYMYSLSEYLSSWCKDNEADKQTFVGYTKNKKWTQIKGLI